MPLINEHGEIHSYLIDLMLRTIDKREALSATIVQMADDPATCNSLLQKQWMQNQEFRFRIKGIAPTSDELGLLRKLNCTDPIEASPGIYAGAFLLGTTFPRVIDRLSKLISEYERWARFEKLFILGSNRKLDPVKESGEALYAYHAKTHGSPGSVIDPLVHSTEFEMMRFVVGGAKIPDSWEVVHVPTADVMKKDSTMRPANTGETFQAWAKLMQEKGLPTRGRYLVGSNQPFVDYQVTNARRTFKELGLKDIEVVGVGPKATESLPFATFLDNLAKQFYEECLSRGFITL